MRPSTGSSDRVMVGKALRVYFKLNHQTMCYTPLSFRGLRAARLMPLIRAKYLQG
jgi:hypothetical protein